MKWLLVIQVIAGGFGTVTINKIEHTSEQKCLEASKAVQVHQPGSLAQGERGHVVLVYCKQEPTK